MYCRVILDEARSNERFIVDIIAKCTQCIERGGQLQDVNMWSVSLFSLNHLHLSHATVRLIER